MKANPICPLCNKGRLVARVDSNPIEHNRDVHIIKAHCHAAALIAKGYNNAT